MVKYLRSFITLCLIGIGMSVQAETTAHIIMTSDTQSIYLGDSVVLDIESTGLLDPLDVDQLKASPEFLRETTGTRIAVFDGKVVEIAIRRMEFIPTETGNRLFGPLTGESTSGPINSNSISVNIQAALSTQWQPSNLDIQSNISFSSEQPMVGEQVIVDITLRHTHQIANERIVLPAFTDYDVLPIFEQRRTIEGDGEWRQIAWRYLMHAKRSGEISVAPVRWSGTMIKSRSQRGEFVHDAPIPVLPVTAAPDDRPDWWLPATSVKLSDAWSKTITTLSAGDEIIRTITLTAENVLSSQLPDIAPLPTRALTSTLIRTTRRHELKNDRTVATGVFEYRMVAQSPIPVFLDTVRVPWWDVVEGKHAEAILPARRINVGLPDRADLLADLAINKSNWARLIFTLRSYAAWQPVLIGLSAIFALIALYPLLRDGVKLHFHDRKRKKTLQVLERLRAQQNWQGLYHQLTDSTVRQKNINTNSNQYKSLVAELQQVLFSKKSNVAYTVLSNEINLPFTATGSVVAAQHVKPL